MKPRCAASRPKSGMMELASAPSSTHTMKLISKYRKAQVSVGQWPERMNLRSCIEYSLQERGGWRLVRGERRSLPPLELASVFLPRHPACPTCHLLQVDRTEFQLRLLGHTANGADRQIIGGVPFAIQVAPMKRHKHHSLGHTAPQPGRELHRPTAAGNLHEIAFFQPQA